MSGMKGPCLDEESTAASSKNANGINASSLGIMLIGFDLRVVKGFAARPILREECTTSFLLGGKGRWTLWVNGWGLGRLCTIG